MEEKPISDTAPTLQASLEREMQSRAQISSATQADHLLLKQAYALLDEAEERIQILEARISQLESLAETDSLTGLLNRRGFERFFENEQDRARRYASSSPCLLVLMDLDGLKQINDTYGHQAGDACLQLVGRRLMSSLRRLDGVARFGGDEFAVLLTHIDLESAIRRVEALQAMFDSLVLEWEGKALPVGASFGVCHVTAESRYEDVYKMADAMMYDDKRQRKAARAAANPAGHGAEAVTA